MNCLQVAAWQIMRGSYMMSFKEKAGEERKVQEKKKRETLLVMVLLQNNCCWRKGQYYKRSNSTEALTLM